MGLLAVGNTFGIESLHSRTSRRARTRTGTHQPALHDLSLRQQGWAAPPLMPPPRKEKARASSSTDFPSKILVALLAIISKCDLRRSQWSFTSQAHVTKNSPNSSRAGKGRVTVTLPSEAKPKKIATKGHAGGGAWRVFLREQCRGTKFAGQTIQDLATTHHALQPAERTRLQDLGRMVTENARVGGRGLPAYSSRAARSREGHSSESAAVLPNGNT